MVWVEAAGWERVTAEMQAMAGMMMMQLMVWVEVMAGVKATKEVEVSEGLKAMA